MAFVVRVPPPPAPTPAPLARWHRALAITRAVGLASEWGFYASIAAMATGFLTCSKEWPAFRDSRGENCPAFHAGFTAFRVSMFSFGMASWATNLLETFVACYKAKVAVTLKSLGGIAIFVQIVPAAGILLIDLGILLESWSAKGSLMETVVSVTVYAGMGMMVLFIAAVAVVLYVVVASVATAVWECLSDA